MTLIRYIESLSQHLKRLKSIYEVFSLLFLCAANWSHGGEVQKYSEELQQPRALQQFINNPTDYIQRLNLDTSLQHQIAQEIANDCRLELLKKIEIPIEIPDTKKESKYAYPDRSKTKNNKKLYINDPSRQDKYLYIDQVPYAFMRSNDEKKWCAEKNPLCPSNVHETVTAFSWDPGENQICAVGTESGDVYILDTNQIPVYSNEQWDSERKISFPHNIKAEYKRSRWLQVTCVRWALEGKLLVVGHMDGTLNIYDAQTQRLIRTLFTTIAPILIEGDILHTNPAIDWSYLVMESIERESGGVYEERTLTENDRYKLTCKQSAEINFPRFINKISSSYQHPKVFDFNYVNQLYTVFEQTRFSLEEALALKVLTTYGPIYAKKSKPLAPLLKQLPAIFYEHQETFFSSWKKSYNLLRPKLTFFEYFLPRIIVGAILCVLSATIISVYVGLEKISAAYLDDHYVPKGTYQELLKKYTELQKTA